MVVNIFDQTQAPRLALENINRVVYSRLSRFENYRTHLGISLKYVISGEEDYGIGNTLHHVKTGQYLLVNHLSELYTSISSEQPVIGLCLYLRPELLMEVSSSLTIAPLEEKGEGKQGPKLCEQVYDSRLSRAGRRLRYLAGLLSSGGHEIELDPSFYYEAAAELLADQNSVQQNLARIDCVKSSTREELFRRLNIARSFIHDNLGEELDLDRIAREACLSKFHFLRLFKQVFNQTPHQYLIHLRLDKARQLLEHTDTPLSDICMEIGLRDLSSFGRRFKQTFGQNPSAYRKAMA